MKKYAILFGGVSFEHEISIVSAITLKKLLSNDTLFIFCDEFREFYLIEAKDLKASYFSKKEYKKCDKLLLKNGGFYRKTLLKEKRVEFDLLINLIHGKEGEEGIISSLLDFFSIDYIGPRVEASVISFNKEFTKLYASARGVKTLPYVILSKGSKKVSPFDYPVIVKPLRLGSSIGLGIAGDEREFDYALDEAFEYDDIALIEPFYKDIKEYNLAGTKTKDGFLFSMVEEPTKEGLLDFDKKYLDFSRSGGVNRANLDDKMVNEIKNAFKNIYDDLFSGALIRCDFFEKDGILYLNEINPIPGSLANYLFDNFIEVLDKIYIPKKRDIKIDYRYINQINAAKGK